MYETKKRKQPNPLAAVICTKGIIIAETKSRGIQGKNQQKINKI